MLPPAEVQGRRTHSRNLPTDSQPRTSEFIAGPENRLAAVAAAALLDARPDFCSPLVLCGPTGVGKTHLARGLAARWLAEHGAGVGSGAGNRVGAGGTADPERGAIVRAGSEFASDFAAAVTDDTLGSYRQRLVSAGLLVIDDVGQLAGKTPAQGELGHILDERAAEQRLTLVTLKTAPAEATGLSARLRSRLSGGLVVPIALPGPEARRVLLTDLASRRGLSVSDEAIRTLADRLDVSAAGLLGALMELEMVDAPAAGKAIGQNQALSLLSRHGGEKLTLRMIAVATGKSLGLTLAELKSADRRQRIATGRQIAMYLARRHMPVTLQEIGAFFGGRDHTTVLHSCRRVELQLKGDAVMRRSIADIRKLLAQEI